MIEVQVATTEKPLPPESSLIDWAETVLSSEQQAGDIVIRLVDEEESQQLNQQFRHKNAATNVLSFPFEAPEQIEVDHLGDLVICAQVVKREAEEQDKPVDWHWAHMVVHGVLHLLGYDHIDLKDAEIMENKEIGLLKKLGINNPYEC